ncbi:hypothetical protein A7975_19710 [Bacillus sp. FJAT-26390]|nr:hypothetical protein A7975_19710 [Bacillus sp. FJAT-26390]
MTIRQNMQPCDDNYRHPLAFSEAKAIRSSSLRAKDGFIFLFHTFEPQKRGSVPQAIKLCEALPLCLTSIIQLLELQ